MVHGFTPALAIRQEVSNNGIPVLICFFPFAVRYMRCLEVDGIQASENAVVGKCHLCSHIVCRVGRLKWIGDTIRLAHEALGREID